MGGLWRLPDCKELVGATHIDEWGWSCRFVNSHVYTLWNI